MFMTRSEDVSPHRDPKDSVGTLIAWVNDNTAHGGGFVLFDLMLKFNIKHLTVAFLRSKYWTHGSIKPKQGDRFGVAFTNRTHIDTRAFNMNADPKNSFVTHGS